MGLGNYPNPFVDQTFFRFHLREANSVQLQIFNSLGQPVRMLEDRVFEAGEYLLKWNGTDQAGKPLSAGVYFYQLTIGHETTEVKKMVLQR